jgi:hypothetical protein
MPSRARPAATADFEVGKYMRKQPRHPEHWYTEQFPIEPS